MRNLGCSPDACLSLEKDSILLPNSATKKMVFAEALTSDSSLSTKWGNIGYYRLYREKGKENGNYYNGAI